MKAMRPWSAANLLGRLISGACAFDASVENKLFDTFGSELNILFFNVV